MSTPINIFTAQDEHKDMPDFTSKDTQNEQDFDLAQFKLDDQTFMAQFQANMAAFYKQFPDQAPPVQREVTIKVPMLEEDLTTIESY